MSCKMRHSLLLILLLVFYQEEICSADFSTTGFDLITTTAYTTSSGNCTPKNGTPITILMDQYFKYWGVRDAMKRVLDRVSAKFPCVQRQYTSAILDLSETYESTFTDADSFLAGMNPSWDWNDYYHFYRCEQSLLYGLKRALEISPDEAFILVFSFGSIYDINDAQLFSDVLTLLEQKRSQVYVLYQSNYCPFGISQQEIFENITALTFGEVIDLSNHDIYSTLNSMELLISKPINASSHILSLRVNVSETYAEMFNIPTSMTYLLIITDGNLKLNFNDPGGNKFEYDKVADYYYYYYQKPHLIKNPAPGTWILNISGNGQLDLKILGFTESGSSGKCSDCVPNASCDEFGGYQECTCKEGFIQNGLYCNDIDECQDYYGNDCHWNTYGCVNTIGSYSCSCYNGFEYKEGLGCVDIDECSNSSLNNCHPLAICTNTYYGFYCTCPYGYYGDGRYCEVNECQQGVCGSGTECNKYLGSYSCFDPCMDYTELNDPWRSVSNTYNYWNYWNWYHCDYSLSGWYRFKGIHEQKIPDYCVPIYSCGTSSTMWINGSHPAIDNGIVNRTACANWGGNCCLWSNRISVKMCPGDFYVYKLQGTPTCDLAYCTVTNNSCNNVDCASDEECLTVNGNNGCFCKDTASNSLVNGFQSDNPADYVKPQIICGLENVQVTFSKCLLEKLGYDPSSIHLRDANCRGGIERSDKSYVTVTSKTSSGFCGASILLNETEVTYVNTVYLSSKYDGVIIRDEYPIDFHCSYLLNMDISLLTAINSFTAAAVVNLGGTSNYTITMGLFQDSAYSIAYTGTEVWLPSTSKMYVGVIASGNTGSSQFVLIMKNCYATPTSDRNFPTKYDIIKDHCPNKNDPTISIDENGASLKGRFSLQVFKFLGGYSNVYLHCQIGLCNKETSSCSAGCPSSRAAVDFNTQNFTLGPIIKVASSTSDGGSPTSDGDTAVSLTKCILTSVVLFLQFLLVL